MTFLFTDVEGSTKLWEQRPDQMRTALADHDEILRSSISDASGIVFSTAGDAFAAAFQDPGDAVTAAAAAQRELDRHDWPDDAALRVRMGLHTGLAHQRDDDYFGPTLNRAARLMSAAHGGQVVLSSATQELVADAPLLDMGEHRLKDLSRPERVWQLIVEGLLQDFPPLRTLNAVPTNLPTDLGSFVGRDEEISALMRDLADNRLVVMTGVGGVGKTRLSLQVAADASHHYPRGLYFIELAPVTAPEAVDYTVLETLGLEVQPGQTALQSVAARIGDGAMLLVIDNCEHVSRAAGNAISQLLTACPNLKVLASSRRSLGVAGEQVRRIQPLDTAGPGNAAAQLFLDRASAAGQQSLDDRTDVIVDICRRLDGVPLAIELAAARTRSMTPEEIADRLDERLRLLKGGRGASNERHQTLLSTIEWSYQLLDEDQKLLFRRLSVFAGSFTLRSAEQVCSDDQLDEFDVLDLLDELVDQSLVIADMTGEVTRFRMLESLRQFAHAELGDAIGPLRDRHAEFHVSWAEQLFAKQCTSQEAAAVAEIEAGWSDLRAAAQHAAESPALLARLISPLIVHALYRSVYEVADWALAGLAAADAHGAGDHERHVFLGAAAGLTGMMGHTTKSLELVTELLELVERTGISVSPEVAMVVPGIIMSGRIDLADRLQSLCEASAPADPPVWLTTMSAFYRAVTETYLGRPDRAREAALVGERALPADFSPSMSAVAGWVIAMHSGAPRADVARQMEVVIEQASLVRSTTLTAIFRQYHSSVAAELGDLRAPLVEAAENLQRVYDQKQYGLSGATVRRAAALLLRTGHTRAGATLLGWVDEPSTNAIPATADLATQLERLVPEAETALGAEDYAAARAEGARLDAPAAITLCLSSLHAAAEELS